MAGEKENYISRGHIVISKVKKLRSYSATDLGSGSLKPETGQVIWPPCTSFLLPVK